MQPGMDEIDLLPPEGAQFGCSQAVPEGILLSDASSGASISLNHLPCGRAAGLSLLVAGVIAANADRLLTGVKKSAAAAATRRKEYHPSRMQDPAAPHLEWEWGRERELKVRNCQRTAPAQ
jgi:hypothetical protein